MGGPVKISLNQFGEIFDKASEAWFDPDHTTMLQSPRKQETPMRQPKTRNSIMFKRNKVHDAFGAKMTYHGNLAELQRRRDARKRLNAPGEPIPAANVGRHHRHYGLTVPEHEMNRRMSKLLA